jgi:nicotinic acetylcholine receptor alpha-7
VSFNLFTVNSYNEVEGTLSVMGALTFRWTDRQLSWEPSEYDGLDSLIVPQTKVWTPTVVILNDAYKLTSLGSDVSFTIRIRYDGDLFWTTGRVFNVKCAADIMNFPFDSHSCQLRFAGWGYNHTIGIIPNSKLVYLLHFEENLDWKLTGSAMSSHSFSSFHVILNFTREPLYYNVLVFTPTAVLALLNPLVFILPIECGERLSFGMTILLSYVVFLTLVSDEIPATSNPMSFLIIFIVVLFITSAAIIVCNIINTKLWYGSDDVKTMSGCKRCLVVMFSGKMKKSEISDDKNIEDTITSKDLANTFDKIYFGFYCVVMFVLMSVYFLVMHLH